MPFALSQGDCVQITWKTVLSLTYPYGLSRQPLPQRVPSQHSSTMGVHPGRARKPGQADSHHSGNAQGIRVAEQGCHTGREELQLSPHTDVPIPPFCNPRGSQQEAGKQPCAEELQGAAQLSGLGQESPAQRKTTQGQKRTHRSLPSPITGLTESTLEEKKGNHFSSAVRRFTASDPIFPLPNRDRLKKLESDEMMLLS